MSAHRWIPFAALAAIGLGGGCQFVSGLSGLHAEGTGGASTSTTSANTGGSITTSSSTGTGGSGGSTTTSSSTGTGGSGGSSTMSSSTGAGGSGGSTTTTSSSTSTTTSTGGTTIVTSVSGGAPIALASDGSYVYWGTPVPPWQIVRIPVAGGMASAVVDGAPLAIVVDATHVFWIETIPASYIVQRALKGGNDTAHPIAAATASYSSPLWLVGGNLHWSSKDTIHRAPAAGGAITSLAAQMAGNFNYTFGADAGRVYWADLTTATIHAESIPAVNTTEQLSDGTSAALIVADENSNATGFVYWTTSTPPLALMRAKKDMSSIGGAEKIATIGDNFTRIMVTPKHVYWAEPLAAGSCLGQATVMRAAVANPTGTIESLATVQACPLFAKDAQAVYWNDGSAINRLADP